MTLDYDFRKVRLGGEAHAEVIDRTHPSLICLAPDSGRILPDLNRHEYQSGKYG